MQPDIGDYREPRLNGTTEALLVCGAIAGPLFTVAFIVEGATRANYNPWRHPVSSLALGDSGWTQTTVFVVSGLLMLAYAAGLKRASGPIRGSVWGPLLFAAIGVGLLGAGIFATDPISGYPPGTPDRLLQYSAHGLLHQLFSALVFFALPAVCLVCARRFARSGERGWVAYSSITTVVFAAAFLLASAAFGQAAGLVALGGLFQRVALTVGWAWLTLLAVYLLRLTSRPQKFLRPAK